MSGLVPSHLLKEARALITQNSVGSSPEMGILTTQEGLEKVVHDLESLKAEPQKRAAYLKRVASAVHYLSRTVLPQVQQQIESHKGLHDVWTKYKQIHDIYASELPKTEEDPYEDEKVNVNEEEVLKEIEQWRVIVTNASTWTRSPNVEDAKRATNAVKVGSIKIARAFATLARYYYYNKKKQLDVANSYWKRALEKFQGSSQLSSSNPGLNYENWLDLSKHWMFRFQLHARKICSYPMSEITDIFNNCLHAVTEALKIKKTEEALQYHWMALQTLDDYKKIKSEESLKAYRDFLNSCADTTSESYKTHARLYGELLAGRLRLEEARDWIRLCLLKWTDPLTFLTQGKIEDHLGNLQEALKCFERANREAPDNVEIRLWYIFHQAKLFLADMRAIVKNPEDAKIKEVVDIANQFCAVVQSCDGRLDEQTSTFIPLRTLVTHFYATTVPGIADLLIRLQQYEFSLFLHQRLLGALDKLIAAGYFENTDRVKLLTRIGTIYYFQQDLKNAEKYLCEALQMDNACLNAYTNLVSVYADLKNENKLDEISITVRRLLNGSKAESEKDDFSEVFFNLGTAYVMLDQKGLEKAQECYRLSIQYNPNNWGARIHLARVLVITNGLEEARSLLLPFVGNSSSEENTFGESPQTVFQIYFCLAGVIAILGDTGQATQIAQKAGSTRYDSEETTNLLRYINALRDPKNDKATIMQEFITSIRKMGFTFRVGKIINPQPIIFNPKEFVGYHGTIDCFLDNFKEGIKPQKAETRQYRGKGFYLTHDRAIACYFAKKKAIDEKKGNPVLIKVYARKELTGKNIEVKTQPNTKTEQEYDFIHSEIDGFEAYRQYYVLENSLQKLSIHSLEDVDKVDWTDKDYEDFIKKNTRGSSC